jgi:hypothetical protein
VKYSPEVDPFEHGAFNSAPEEDRLTVSLDTFTGKLKTFCPSLFYSLSTWEHDSLDSSLVLETGNTQVTSCGRLSDREGFNTIGVDPSFPVGGGELNTTSTVSVDSWGERGISSVLGGTVALYQLILPL